MNTDGIYNIFHRHIKELTSTDDIYIRSAFDDIVSTYKSPAQSWPRQIKREYHDFQHIIEGMDFLNCTLRRTNINILTSFLSEDIDLFMAWLFHDVIYEAGLLSKGRNHNNEKRSGLYAFNVLTELGIRGTLAGRIHDLIMYTKHDKLPPDDDETALILVDIDLMRAASSWEVFRENSYKIRREMNLIDDPNDQWKEGRVKFWQSFLKLRNNKVFQTEYFEHFNSIALSNIEREIDTLNKVSQS